MADNNMAKPKMSMLDLFQKYRDCYDYRKDPTIEEQQTAPEARQLMAERFRERKQAASEYASSLIPLGNDWIEAVKHGVKALTQRLPPSLHFNKVERDAYRDGVVDFLIDVAEALREYGKGHFLNDDYFDPVTLYRFGIMTDWEEPQTGLTKDEATKICKDFKQRYSKVYCFPDLFSMFPSTYTVMGYKAKASTPARAQNKATSGFNSMGLGSNATTNQQTQPAAKKPASTRKRGRPQKEFKDFFFDATQASKIIPILGELLNGKCGKDAARIIVACYYAKWITEPTVRSISREFGIEECGLKEPLRCHFHYESKLDLKFKPFPDDELIPIVDLIKTKLS